MKAIFKVVYDIDDEDDVNFVRDMPHAHQYKEILRKLYNHLRHEVRNNANLSVDACEAYSIIRQRMFMLLSEYGVRLE